LTRGRRNGGSKHRKRRRDAASEKHTWERLSKHVRHIGISAPEVFIVPL